MKKRLHFIKIYDKVILYYSARLCARSGGSSMKHARRMLSILLTLALLLGTLAVSFVAFGAYVTGSIIKFGNYPQSQVTDSKLIGKLADVQKHWKSFGYYSGTGSWDDGKMAASDFAIYADFTYENAAYRAILFTKYRPKQSGGVASPTSGNGSGYSTDLIYYFKYEPIEWIVLSAANGVLMSKKVLDSQPYQNLVKKSGETFSTGNQDANDYANSSLRAFLNGSFYNTAFSPAQKSAIAKRVYNCAPYASADSTSVTDNVTVLSYNDCRSAAYGFSSSIYVDAKRIADAATPYAVSQGISLSDGKADWWLRTPDAASGRVSCVEANGALSHTSTVNLTDKGIRPVICLPILAENTEVSMLKCEHKNGTESFEAVTPSCEKAGHTAYEICKDCSAVVKGSNAEIPANGHVDKKMLNGKDGSDGWCDVCGAELTVHLDNSGKVQINGPMKGILDLIRKLVLKIEGLMDRLSVKKDDKKDGKTDETTTSQSSTNNDVDLTETGKTFDDFATLLGGIINSFKDISDKKSTEKEQDRSDFLDFLRDYSKSDE